MNVPTWAGFVAYLPDDEVATQEDIVEYGGRNVAKVLGEIFTDLGCTRVSELWSVGEVGWEFDFQYGGRHSFKCRVQSFHPIYWLLFEGPSGRRAEAAYGELWRKFADALVQDSRFDQILWRSFKEGPPDWDEFTVTDDLPKSAPPVDLPVLPIKPKPVAAGGPLAPVIIGGWCALTVVVVLTIEATTHGSKEQSASKALAIVALIVGLAVFLRVVDRRRKADQNSAPDADSDA